jgi:hypothetical protein
MNSGARGHYTRSIYENGKYGTWDATANHNNRNTCLGFKGESIENFKFDWSVHMHVRPRALSFWSYQGDEVAIKGLGDITFKLPAVPAGTYELRIATIVGFTSRGVRQFLLDGEIIRDSVDFRPNGELIGWVHDNETTEEAINSAFSTASSYITDSYKEQLYAKTDRQLESALQNLENRTNLPRSWWQRLYTYPEEERSEILMSTLTYRMGDNDAYLRSNGWMKGPASYYNANSEAGGTKSSNSFRGLNNTLRCIIGTFTTDGKTDHYLTIKTLEPLYGNSEFNLDYIELCPSTVYNNKTYPEDKW